MNRAQDLSKRANVCNSVLSNDKISRAMLLFDGWEQSKVRKKRTASKFEVTAASIAPKPLLDGEGPDQLVQQKTHGWSRFVMAQKIRHGFIIHVLSVLESQYILTNEVGVFRLERHDA